MFSSHRRIKRKTPEEGIDRRAYIGHLVDEYYTSTNVEAAEQVTANLANFAYDPINWPHLLEADALDLFVASLDTKNPNLQLHAAAALCNFCLDKTAAKFIIENIAILREVFVRTEHAEIVLHSLALHHQLLSSGFGNKELLVTPDLLKRVQHWRQKSNDGRVVKLCQVFLEDYGCRTEITEINNAPPNAAAASSAVQSSHPEDETAAGSSGQTLHSTRS